MSATLYFPHLVNHEFVAFLNEQLKMRQACPKGCLWGGLWETVSLRRQTIRVADPAVV